MNLDAFSATIERIYAAAADPSEWSKALNAIEDLTGSVGAVIDFIPRNHTVAPLTIAGRFTLEQCATYASEYQGVCRRIGYSVAHPETPIHYDAMVLSEIEMDHDPVYAWLGQNDLRYYIGAQLPPSERHLIYASLQRSPKQGHVEPDDIRLFELVSAHLGRAVALAERLGTLENHASISHAYLDRLPHALLALDRSGRLVFANRAGDALLSREEGVACKSGRLVALHSADRLTFAKVLADAAEPGPGTRDAWMRLRASDGEVRFVAFVSHINVGDGEFAHLQPCVLVAIGDPCDFPGVPPESLRDAYGLTMAQARIACGLAQSGDSEDFALGIAPETLKSHLKAIFRKLDVHRRQDVVQIVTNLARLGGSPPNGG